ncbi:hypothetical protein [Halobaculum magnesiiphilum]|uniref:Right handed beta helix region n=1 Tax=Halobaculum magnesiiphilum TaxID=1017351 RepID=A0A8T8WIN5_9EURY|nr:hypothetical protein [Halobaculum magnesiiphilum]QZP39690.1 hypothetical protein K6T50_17055 [Halobaculum magnesiiphilum]
MADSHTGDADEKESTTEQKSEDTASASRRTLLKGIGAFATVGGAGALASEAATAAGDFGEYSSPSGEVRIPAGEYTWNDDDLDIGSGDALIGEGNPGDVVVNLEGGTMDGWIEGRLENIVVRGRNNEARAGLYVVSGCEIDGFHWPEGGNQSRDRAMYNPEGGERAVVRNSSWAWMGNNGAYTDKLPMTFENCVAANSNISNIRIGHRRGTDVNETTYVRNCLIAVTDPVRTDDTNVRNGRGLRMRHPGNFVVENCYFVAMDVDGVGNPIVAHDGAAGSTLTVRNCHFYNDSSGDIIRDKTGGDIDVTVENCTFQGSGSDGIEPDYDGNGIVAGSPEFPLPSDITGYAVSDEIEGIEPGVGPWGDGSVPVEPDPAEYDHTLVLHADADNPQTDSATPGDFDMDIVVTGEATYGDEAEPGSDTITTTSDGNTLIEVQDLQPDELDSFRFNGEVVDYVVDDGYEYSVSLNGTTTTFEELVNGEVPTDDGSGDDSSGDGSTDDGSTDDGGSNDGSTDDGSTDDGSTDDGSTDDGGSNDGSTDDGSTDDGSTDDGSTDDGSTDDGSTDDGDRTYDDDLSNQVVVNGADNGSPTNYTFTVSGEVVRDTEASSKTEDGTDWDRVEDFARDGKVIGVVGSGVDAYRFSGTLTGVTVDGEADLTIERGA